MARYLYRSSRPTLFGRVIPYIRSTMSRCYFCTINRQHEERQIRMYTVCRTDKVCMFLDLRLGQRRPLGVCAISLTTPPPRRVPTPSIWTCTCHGIHLKHLPFLRPLHLTKVFDQRHRDCARARARRSAEFRFFVECRVPLACEFERLT